MFHMSPEPIKKTNNNVALYEDKDLFLNSHGAFLYKKAERIVMAIYMISEFFPSKEPLKWNMRQVSTSIIKDILVLTKKPTAETIRTLKNVHRSFLEVSSYISLGHVTGLISNMNFTILNQEVLKVSEELEGEMKRHPDIKETIKSDFFQDGINEKNTYKGHVNTVKDSTSATVSEVAKLKMSNTVDSSDLLNKGNNFSTAPLKKDTKKDSATDSGLSNGGRQQKILDILREKGKVSIRDIVYQIPGCSSKTIQRDLIKLIQDGLVSKEGDRRWSIYFLKP